MRWSRSANAARKTAETGTQSRRWLARWLIVVTTLVAFWLLASLLVAYRMTHRVRPWFAEPAPVVAWAKFESIRILTSDEQEVGAWFSPGRAELPSIILIHGNGGSRGSLVERSEILVQEGYSVLPITLRAHGDSSGVLNDFGFSARRDVIAAVEWIERRRPGKPIFVLGASLGAAAAIFSSKELGTRVAGYILEAPYRDLRSAVRNRTRAYLPIGLEWVAYQGLLAVSPLVLSNVDQLSPRDAIGGIPDRVPVLILAGRRDDKSTPDQVEDVLTPIRNHGKLVFFEDAGHLKFLQADPSRYRTLLLTFLRDSRENVVEPSAPE